MNILVTGGAGFIASHVVDAYIGAGHAVTVLDNLSSGNHRNLNPRATFVQMDIRDKAIRELFSSGSFEVVNHHAAQMDVRKSVEDPLFDANVNILGTLNLLQQSLASGVRKFIFASTGGAIYGEQDYFPADENHPTRPLSPYGISKLSIEKYLFYYHQVQSLPYTILRYANVYGPRQSPHGEAGVVAIFTTRMLNGGQPVINGDGKQTRDYVFVRDVARANLIALDDPTIEIYNIGTGVETDVNELFHHLKTLTGSSCSETHAEAKKGEQLRSLLSYQKIEKAKSWTPRIPLATGLAETVDYFRQLQG